MRFLVVYLVLVTFLFADEMQRIEAIVSDITQLRNNYKECQLELKDKKISSMNARISNENENNIEFIKMKKEMLKYKDLLKVQLDENDKLLDENELLENKYNRLLKTKQKKVKNTKTTSTIFKYKLEEPNKFPTLMMKEELRESKKEKIKPAKKVDKTDKKKDLKNEIEKFKARPFCLNVDSYIYDSPNGKVLEQWEEKTSFTSNQKMNKWVKITGYFVNQKWTRAKKDIWIQEKYIKTK